MSKPMRVLLVEDDGLILMQMEAMVEDAGHLVAGTAMRTAEAVDLAREARPDLALVDRNLGGGDSGIDVAKALLAQRDVMVVFVTGDRLAPGDDLAGAAGVIAKPFTRAVIANGIPYLEACLRDPPPRLALPPGMRMAPRYLADQRS